VSKPAVRHVRKHVKKKRQAKPKPAKPAPQLDRQPLLTLAPAAALPAAAAGASSGGGIGATSGVLLAALCLALLLFGVAVTPAERVAAAPLGRLLVGHRTDAGFLGFVVLAAIAIGFLVSRGSG
jgi:hypothetical protein